MKLSELLQKLLDNINTGNLTSGLCYLNFEYNYDYNYHKYFTVGDYLINNRPLTWRTLLHPRKSVYWWKPGLVEPRKKWLEKHIKKLKAKGL